MTCTVTISRERSVVAHGDPHVESVESVPSTSDSWALVDVAQKGDLQAFAALYRRYATDVYRFAVSRTGDLFLAEDVTSETFLRALRNINSIEYRGHSVRSWFIKVAHNIILDHAKSARFRREVIVDELPEQHAPEPPEYPVFGESDRRQLLAVIANLSTDQRECIVSRFFRGLSVAETARLMNRNDGALKALQHRAIRRLGQLIGPRPA